jgi:hypothetical protein
MGIREVTREGKRADGIVTEIHTTENKRKRKRNTKYSTQEPLKHILDNKKIDLKVLWGCRFLKYGKFSCLKGWEYCIIQFEKWRWHHNQS